MARTINTTIVIVCFILIFGVVTLLDSTEAATYTVGDSLGWQNPTSSTYYSTWASQHNFSVGDVLVFNFATGAHDVATVTQDAYTNCNTASNNIVSNGPASITLTATGQQYYICTFSGHCSVGQKLAVNVVGSASTTPSPPGSPPSSTAPPPPPPPPKSASTSLAASFALMFMFIAMGAMCYF